MSSALFILKIHTLESHLGAKCGKNCGYWDTLDNFSLILVQLLSYVTCGCILVIPFLKAEKVYLRSFFVKF